MQKTVLIAGASGSVGLSAVKHFARAGGWRVLGVSRRVPGGVEGAALVPVDLSDRRRCAEVFGQMPDVTHLVYAAVHEQPGLVQGWRDPDQMATNLAMLQNLLEPLSAAARGLEHVSLLQGTKAYGVHLRPAPVPARERWPRREHENFYFLQEDYLRAKQAGASWSWTILRPQIIFGEALGSNLNPMLSLAVYGALLREAGEPLHFPGGVPPLQEAVDAELLARALEWAATSTASRNEIFNVTNGDVFAWENVWPVVADALGMKPGEPRPLRLGEQMASWAPVWRALVRRHRLRAPEDLGACVGQSFVYLDLLLATGREPAYPPALVSTVKIRQAGFADCVDTEDMLRKWIGRFQEERLIPPVGPGGRA